MPDSVSKSTSTVGLPRLSKTLRAVIVLILTFPSSAAAIASATLALPVALSAAMLIMPAMGCQGMGSERNL
eukprot:UN10478